MLAVEERLFFAMPLESSPVLIVVSVPDPSPDEHSIPTRDENGGHSADDPVSMPTAEEAEILQASIKAGSVAQIVVAVIAVIGLIYLLKLVMVTVLFSILLAFVLEPLVGRLARIHISRAVGALLAVALMVGLAGGLTYFFYSPGSRFRHAIAKIFRQDSFGSG